MTPGIRTSEFWFAVVSALVVGLTAILDSNAFVAYPVIAGLLVKFLLGLNAIYTIGRSLVKASAKPEPMVG